MKIAQVTPVYPPYRGGIGKVAEEYTERLRALGHTVEVFTPSFKIGNAGFLDPMRSLKGFDVVHLHYPFYGGAEQVALGSSLGGAPIILTYHMDAKANGIKGAVLNLHRRILQPLILRRAAKILVSSLDYAKHSALDRFRQKEKILEMPFGVDITRFHPVATEAEGELRQELRIPHDVPVLLFVGGLDEAHIFKGMPVLLQALCAVTSPFHLVVVGEGNLRASFEATAETMECRHNIHFVGGVSDEELPTYYRASDVHIFPSTTTAEAFGLVALEAAASGIPTIASDLPGVRTVVRAGETGLLVAPGDEQGLAAAIERLLKNRDEREKLGAAARKRVVEEYSSDILIEKLVGIYENCHRH